MNRRVFASALAAAAAPLRVQAFQNVIRPGRLKISGLEILRLQGTRQTTAGINRQHQVNPLHIYAEHRPKPYSEGEPRQITQSASALYFKIKTDQGLEGLYGPIDREAALVADQQLRTFLAGKDPLAGETLWDQLHRLNRHSRRGHFMMAISAVDNALWDLRGRYFNTPVYRLLGGPARNPVEAYASCLGFSVEPEAVRKVSVQFKNQGFRNQKWFLAYGPGDDREGLAKNVGLVKNLREALGDDVDIMFDAFMGWNLDYAIAWAKRVEPYRPRWIEEAFQADKIDSFVQLRRATSVPVASGEHFYGRWEVQHYLKAGAVSVVQADPEWCGGTSELVKICALASVYDAQVIPHGHSLHAALHVVASQSPMTCPLVEYLVNKMQSYYLFEKHQLTPIQGRIALPDRPGFGIEFDPAKVEKQTVVSWS
ncbi:MAG: mandelate racemase [Acidobacteria bacterium]|nr:mandelate racemase [Acidobacteriota bacterium]MBI3278205.1 mandelate racemase [Acidobacteriota bacterium]